VVLPVWDQTLPTLIVCLDATLRRIGGAPVYALTDNEQTVTVEHIAGGADPAPGDRCRRTALRHDGAYLRPV
jgi:hypothetical protein